MIKNLRFILLFHTLFLGGCSNQARHIPPLWQLPSAMLGSSIENKLYNIKRNSVKKYVITNYNDLRIEVKKGEGLHLTEALRLASAPLNNIQAAKQQLQKDYLIMFENTDNISEYLMHYYASLYVDTISKNEKTINGFYYDEAHNIIQDYIKDDFNSFRRSIKENDRSFVEELLSALRIERKDKKEKFLEHLFNQYDHFFIEPIVVGIIVTS